MYYLLSLVDHSFYNVYYNYKSRNAIEIYLKIVIVSEGCAKQNFTK